MSKKLFALEELDTTVEDTGLPKQTVGERVSMQAAAVTGELDAGSNEIRAQANQIEEATEIRDTVDGLANKVEERIEHTEGIDSGLSDESVEDLEIAVEHFRSRLGFKKKVMPAMEAFKATGKRREASLEALANLKDLSKRTTQAISIAQEGLVTKVNNSFMNASAQGDGVLGLLNHVEHEIRNKGMKKGAIAGGSWSKSLGSFSKNPVIAKDVVNRVVETTKLYLSADPSGTVREINVVFKELLREVVTQGETKNNNANINRKAEQMLEIAQKFEKSIKNYNRTGGYEDFEVATTDAAKTIGDSVKKLVGELSDFSKEWEKLIVTVDQLKAEIAKQNNIGKSVTWRWIFTIIGTPIAPLGWILGYLIGKHFDASVDEAAKAQTVTGGKSIVSDGAGAMELFSNFEVEGIKFCYAAVSYLGESCGVK